MYTFSIKMNTFWGDLIAAFAKFDSQTVTAAPRRGVRQRFLFQNDINMFWIL